MIFGPNDKVAILECPPSGIANILVKAWETGLVENLARPGGKHQPDLHRRRVLRMCCKRTCRSYASKQAGELAALHSITSSARTRRAVGIVRPSALAVLRLMISSTLVACWTGKSKGFSPLRMRPV
jgi:hypothetical protein